MESRQLWHYQKMLTACGRKKAFSKSVAPDKLMVPQWKTTPTGEYWAAQIDLQDLQRTKHDIGEEGPGKSWKRVNRIKASCTNSQSTKEFFFFFGFGFFYIS